MFEAEDLGVHYFEFAGELGAGGYAEVRGKGLGVCDGGGEHGE